MLFTHFALKLSGLGGFNPNDSNIGRNIGQDSGRAGAFRP